MNRRRLGWSLLAIALVAAAAMILLVCMPETEQEGNTWGDDSQFPVRMIDKAWTYNIELTDFPMVEGRVAYEGPAMVEGQGNWKAEHSYRGVRLQAVIDETIARDRTAKTITLVALDGWHKTLPYDVLDGANVAGAPILALSVDNAQLGAWGDAPMLVFLPEDESFSNQDMLQALGTEYAHYFGETPSTTGLMVKGIAFLIIDYDGERLPTVSDLEW